MATPGPDSGLYDLFVSLLHRGQPASAGPTHTAWDRAALRLSESLRLLTPADADMPDIVRLHRLAEIYLRATAEQEGVDRARVAEVEQFIEQATRRPLRVRVRGETR